MLGAVPEVAADADVSMGLLMDQLLMSRLLRDRWWRRRRVAVQGRGLLLLLLLRLLRGISGRRSVAARLLRRKGGEGLHRKRTWRRRALRLL